MKTKLLGRTGVSVSELCFGTMSFGGDADEATSAAMYKAVRDAGINFFDCADEYNKGVSEQILGRLAKGHRDDLVLTTKCFSPHSDDINARGSSRRHVVRAVEIGRDYDVRGTPVLVVDGRYQTGGGQAGSLKNVMPTVDGLINLVRERRKKG